MVNNFQEVINSAKRCSPINVAVAAADDFEVLTAIEEARSLGIINAILIGYKDRIKDILNNNSIDSKNYEIIDAGNKEESCFKAVQLVKEGKASTIMKGIVDTSIVLKAVINKETGLEVNGLISHVGVLKVDKFDKLFLISDSAVVVSPTVQDKVSIINNAVSVAKALGIEEPKVAIICPVEKVNEKIESTVHAAELVSLYKQKEITGCIVGGPFALDNAVSEEAAAHKGIINPIAGKADILIAHNLEVGNVLNKAIEYFGHTEKAGVIMGAGVPIILTSRASSSKSKLNSIALSVLIAQKSLS
ncbi:bifunctional enoyl-CoA hydratase/phosphate acetyltransferase [Sedimentibacter sp.]|uniref:bifunctional enoyl-CoA hydratase/phosphate acetyltransferase n=1 Tax=Sedimentibacter sp. TaxID=1960295 RepID=UPI0028AAED9B|nr:bifunctional enoyl-CoA hydratase/phosphate acetyltransferase [Sedimentibacter sp.]